MSQKARVDRLERQAAESDECEVIEVVLRWPEDPLYLVAARGRLGSGVVPVDFVLRWPDGSEVLPP